jgi:hypothetical protein
MRTDRNHITARMTSLFTNGYFGELSRFISSKVHDCLLITIENDLNATK